ncbi:VanZ family protein [Peribacillus sp. SCS-155]|uniref:VanZ family protein n=1 Tax=Peribacillus sedimenti TaxID=3115297 RepID=UPI003905A28E
MNKISKKHKSYDESRGLKYFQNVLVILWGMLLSIFIFVENLESLFLTKKPDFTWNKSPDFSSFFNFYDITLIHPWWFMVKGGHFLGFAILKLLLYVKSKNLIVATIISILFAGFTEILQLFFGRDGRLYDVVIDSMGILIALLLVKVYHSIGLTTRKTLSQNK